MMQAFCAGANLRVSMELPGCPKILQRCLKIVQSGLSQELRGTLMSDILTLTGGTDTPLPTQKEIKLDADVRMALESLIASEGISISTSDIFHHPKLDIGGLRYTELKTTKGNGTIFFRPTGATDLVPGAIRQIFSLPSNTPTLDGHIVFLAVHRFLPKHESSTTNDPFIHFKDYGASLWDRETASQVEVIRSTQDICHGNQLKWDDDNVVMRPTHKVMVNSSTPGRF
jgi:hypothetical protein